MSDEFSHSPRTWSKKFAGAFRGIRLGCAGQSSFAVHFVCAILVVVAAALLRFHPVQWSLLTLCIFGVLTAELMNSALETISRAVDRRHNAFLADGLDMASGAVLASAIGAVVVGLLLFGQRIVELVL
jgi:diacylglycerol kinase